MIDHASASWAIVTFLIYLVGVFFLAIFSHRLLKAHDFLKEYFLGGRNLGMWGLAMTYAATSASGGSFTGFPSLIYQYGWILALWISGYMVVPVVCMGLLGKRVNQVARKTGAITLPDLFRDRYQSPSIGILISLVLVLFLTVYLVAQFKAGAVILQVLFEGHPLYERLSDSIAWVPDTFSFLGVEPPSSEYCLSLLIFASGVILYTVYGGFRAVVWTDILQGIVMLGGVLILLLLTVSKAGGLESATRGLAAQSLERAVEVYIAPAGESTKDAAIVRKGEELEIEIGGESFRFRSRNDISVPSQSSHNGPVIIYIENHDKIPTRGSSGTGGVIRFIEPPKTQTLRIERYRILPQRTLVAGPGGEPEKEDDFLPLALAISFFIFWPITGAGQPGTLVRLMAFKNTQVYRRAICTVSIYYALIYLPLVAIFVCARNILPPLSEPDQAMPQLVTAVAPSILAGILLAAPFAAIMSTVDSFLLMISSSLIRDIYQRSWNPNASSTLMRRASYFTTLVVGVVVTLGALNPPRFLQDLVIFASAGLACCFLAPIVLSMYWKRATVEGMIAAVLGGLLTTTGLYAVNWVVTQSIGPYNLLGVLPAIWGLAVSFLAGMIVSLLSGPPPISVVRFYFSAQVKDVSSSGEFSNKLRSDPE